MLENAYSMVLIIVIINIIYVSFSTVRMILTLKGRSYFAALVSTVEVVVYIVGLKIVLDNLSEIQNIIAYAIGFALGIIIGTKIEERLALGYITVNVISKNPELPFTNTLRKEGFGVTSWLAQGMEGDRLSLQVLAPRKQEIRLYQLVTEIDPKAFIISYEPKYIQGGFWVKQVRRATFRRKQQQDEEKTLSEEMIKDLPMEEDELDLETLPDGEIPSKPLSHKQKIKPKL